LPGHVTVPAARSAGRRVLKVLLKDLELRAKRALKKGDEAALDVVRRELVRLTTSVRTLCPGYQGRPKKAVVSEGQVEDVGDGRPTWDVGQGEG